MIIRINGQEEKIQDVLTLWHLVEQSGYCADKIVIEYNQRIIAKEEWRKVNLADHDNIEIVSFVAGG